MRYAFRTSNVGIFDYQYIYLILRSTEVYFILIHVLKIVLNNSSFFHFIVGKNNRCQQNIYKSGYHLL